MIYIFDVDGVLTDTGYNIDSDFEKWFVSYFHDKRYLLATGSTLERTREQIGDRIVDNALIVANCMGNSIMQEGRTVTLNEFAFTLEEETFLNMKMKQSQFPLRTGEHIVTRPGSVNYSVVGRNATNEQREQYKQFDAEHQERLAIAKQFKRKFPRFDVFIGGDISIDICLRGANKGQVFDLITPFLDGKTRIAFFGDKFGDYGIDQPLANKLHSENGGTTFKIKNGYHETKHIILSGIPDTWN